MAGFNAAEAVEELTYDFSKYSPGDERAVGSIPEPSTDAIEHYRSTIYGAIKELGLPPDVLSGGLAGIKGLDFDQIFDLVDKSGSLENTMLTASAELTQIPLDVVSRAPYRVKRAFTGYVMGLFFNPED